MAGNRRRTKAQAEICQDRAYFLKVTGGLVFSAIAASPDPTGVLDRLYANGSAARTAYLAGAARARGAGDEQPLAVTERRALMDDRYERLVQAWMPKAVAGSGEATDRVLRALAGQAALHGLNPRAGAPVTDDAGQEDVADELAARRARAREEARAAVRGAATAAPTPPTR